MIVFTSLTKSYDDVRALTDLNLTVRRGEIVALLGPNGSGKTTALKAAAGLIRPTSGTVLIEGVDASRAGARRHVAYLPQRVTFAETLTGREVVDFYRRLRGMDAARTNEVLQLAALNGAGKRAVGTYSGGMLQRLGLAVAAVGDAPILLLDEPTSNLDARNEAALRDAIGAAAQRRTLIVVAHRLSTVVDSDRIIVLDAGRVVATGTHHELLECSPLYRELAAHQLLVA